jgi:hypothetical protein
MSVDIINERNKMIRDLEQTFQLALDAGDYKAAIQAKHIIGKVQGFIESKDSRKKKKDGLSLIELSSEDLEILICEAEDIKKWQAQN